MSDSRKNPPPGPKKSRVQSQDERDAEGFAARRSRESAVVKEFAVDEITGRYEGEELEVRRAERPDIERIGRLEKKHDELKQDAREKHEELKQDVREKHDELKKNVSEVRLDVKTLSEKVGNLNSTVSGAVGKLEGQGKVLGEMLELVKDAATRDHVTFTAKVEVDKAQELAKVEVGKERQLAEIEVVKEEKVDTVKAKSDRRKRNMKILGLVASGGGLIELLHRLGVL